MTILLRCVGIYFQDKAINFKSDMPDEKINGAGFMSGKAILDAAVMNYKLQYEMKDGLILQLGYMPVKNEPISSSAKNFPFYDKHLSLTQNLLPFDPTGKTVSTVFQYTVNSLTKKSLDMHAPFVTNGFMDNCKITIRLLSIILPK